MLKWISSQPLNPRTWMRKDKHIIWPQCQLSRYFTQAPHIGGSNISYEQALYIQKEWQRFGFEVKLKKYDVLLSFPKRPNIASIVNRDGQVSFTAQRTEKVLENDENHPDVVPPFNAFSASGNVTVRTVISLVNPFTPKFKKDILLTSYRGM